MRLDALLVTKRLKETEVTGRDLARELASDRSRIIYSPAFRRLSRKAQVFSLESNAAVRSRITHSLEVSDVGRLIADGVASKLQERDLIGQEFRLPIIYAVECACLVHDIGNPPFGHFGEAAIQRWFAEEGMNSFHEATQSSAETNPKEHAEVSLRMKELMEDFKQFDGNPQGLRILLRLKTDRDAFSYNLTYTTLLSFLKYTRSAVEEKRDSDELTKKAGYFESERDTVERMKADLGLAKDSRYPLAYIMEAADDIAYCICDIEDGLEKRILRYDEFFNDVSKEWKLVSKSDDKFPLGVWPANDEPDEADFFRFKISYTQDAIKAAVSYFVDSLDEIIEGKRASLFDAESLEYKAFQCLKKFSRKKLFRCFEAEDIELAGNEIVHGLLEKFAPLLRLTEDKFRNLILARAEPDKGKGLDVQWRLFNRLPKKHVKAYEYHLQESRGFPEWYFRAHLIVDYISGMTDHFALEQYQLLCGIKIEQNR
ncbi:MAG: dGTPase [Pyrinomonadaceae bacterium]